MKRLIELENIVKDYQSMRALDDVSLQITPGVTGLLGPNGAGKSTLIKVLLGLVKVTSGTGTILGYRLGQDGRKIRQLVGYMPEEDCYIPGLSGVEVVRFAGSLAGIPKVEGLRRAHEILDFCGMEQERYRNVETYSTGMRQKIKFASAIVHDPELLILDEPTSGLDPEERESFLNRIRVLAGQHSKTVILSTHILPDVQATCDHVIILSKGQLRQSESLESLSRPASPTITIQVIDGAQKVADSLAGKGLDSQCLSDEKLTVMGELEEVAGAVWDSAANCEATIKSMLPAKNSLEQIFIDAIKEAGHANV